MSTKMYNLYRYPRNDIYALQEWLETLRLKCQQHAIQEIVEYRKLVRGDLWERLMEDTTKGLRSPFNIDASVVVYLDSLGQAPDMYVQFFGVSFLLYEQEVTEGMFLNSSYQNSSDQPDDVSNEEWERREQVVERLLDKHDSAHADKCGFSYILMDKHDCMWIADQVYKHIHVVCWLVTPPKFVLCIECSPNPPDGNTNHPRLMEIDLERMEATPCGTCGRVFSYGQWREPKKEPEGL